MSFIRNIQSIFRKIPNRLPYRLLSSNAEVSGLGSTAQDVSFPGAKAPFVSKPTLTHPEDVAPVPIYRVMNRDGIIEDPSQDPKLSKEVVIKMFRDMVLLNTMDKVLYESQRQGRIPFYMTNDGEEGAQVGSAAALSPDDIIYGQYRESGVLVWRGYTISEFMDQCFGNCDDHSTKGRQMPLHFGSKKLNFITISSPLATQMPQAVGTAYAIKRIPDNKRIVICYFGEGAASEGDAHACFNFAATLKCPVILFCRNNGYSISTPAREQYSGDGIAGRGAGYGIASIRCDGTDIFAVYNGVKEARDYVLKNNRPVICEAMAYRIGHHSTSDDSTLYRSADEIEIWKTVEHPMVKLKNYMVHQGLYDEGEESAYVKDVRKQILSQVEQSEKKPKPDWKEMFQDVYYDMPQNLKEQQKEFEQHIEKHKEHYPMKNFKSS